MESSIYEDWMFQTAAVCPVLWKMTWVNQMPSKAALKCSGLVLGVYVRVFHKSFWLLENTLLLRKSNFYCRV